MVVFRLCLTTTTEAGVASGVELLIALFVVCVVRFISSFLLRLLHFHV